MMHAELPGLTEEHVEVEVENNILTLRGEKDEERTEGEPGAKVHLWERNYGSFQRSIQLPCEVVAEKATADYRKGVLSVKLPKAPSAKRPAHRIDVKAG